MSIDAALGRIDQIVGLQQQLSDPTGAGNSTTATAGLGASGSTATTATTTPTTTGTTATPSTDAADTADFANELAAATQASSATSLGTDATGAATSDTTGLESSTAASTPSLGESNDSALLSLLSSLSSSSATDTTDTAALDSGGMALAPATEDTELTDPSALDVGDLDSGALETDDQATATPTTATTAVQATSPSDPRITAMTQEADSLLGKPYVYGGGHENWDPQTGYDCSGFVSAVLHAGGYLSTPQDTTSLPSAAGIESGPGQYVTVYDRAQPGQDGHVIIDIDGQFYESGGESGAWGGGGGVEKIGTPSASYLSTFNDVLHPAGL
jgi:cell wall-associated NlpC family hydrolase